MSMASSHRPTSTLSAATLALFAVTVLLSGTTEAQIPPTAAGAPGPATLAGSPGPVTEAGSPGPATEDCLSVLLVASDCLSFVEVGSNSTVPEKGCCGEMKQVLDSRPDCLCQMLAKNNSIGLEFDVKKVLKLPSICHVETPPLSLCSLIGVPIGVPIAAPTATPGGPVHSPSASNSPGASAPGTAGTATTSCHLSGMTTIVGATIALVSFVFTF